MKRQNRKSGFTIVELVIVIAVVAVLSAVLIPTFSNLVKKAEEANVQADAKNLVTEMLADIMGGGRTHKQTFLFSLIKEAMSI